MTKKQTIYEFLSCRLQYLTIHWLVLIRKRQQANIQN